ncbi:MAG: MaoC family dehydratase [Burkholderiaceae bacterium]|nr:MaoC family dehydratase [Rhodoferax sp.]
MSRTIFKTLSDLTAHVGQEAGVSDWVTVTQEQVNQFAQATGDHQWIHVDVERAKAGPFGAPIAHGFLTLSMVPRFFDEALTIEEAGMGINYGLNKVRFMAPVRVGSRLRGRLTLVSCDPIDNNGVQMVWDVVVELEGSAKPACVAQTVSRRYP